MLCIELSDGFTHTATYSTETYFHWYVYWMDKTTQGQVVTK